jgi:hypothetical protein
MSNLKPRDMARSAKATESGVRDLPQQQNGALDRLTDKSEQIFSLMGRVTLESTLEIDRLIDDLSKLRRKLEDEGNRVQRDLADHASFSQSVVQLTKIVSDSMAHVKRDSSPPSYKLNPEPARIAPPTDTEPHIPAFLTALERE